MAEQQYVYRWLKTYGEHPEWNRASGWFDSLPQCKGSVTRDKKYGTKEGRKYMIQRSVLSPWADLMSYG